MCVFSFGSFRLIPAYCVTNATNDRLAWADTAASTFGRLLGSRTPPLPHRLPLLRLPLAPRKSLAGFLAASVTAALAAICFWKFIAPCRPNDLSWQWDGGINQSTFGRSDWFTSVMRNVGIKSFNTGGWLGLGAIGVVAGVVAGVAEALGKRHLL
jgi:diacylglycerol kinase (CTP)